MLAVKLGLRYGSQSPNSKDIIVCVIQICPLSQRLMSEKYDLWHLPTLGTRHFVNKRAIWPGNLDGRFRRGINKRSSKYNIEDVLPAEAG